MSVLQVGGRALPEGEPVDLYADGDQWTTDPVAGADLVAEGWLLPGLVDAHTHPGAKVPGQELDEELLREDLREHVAAGVTMIRSPGLAAVVTAVHAVGGRVAVHTQHAAGGSAAVAAGVDSIEHGMCLDPALLSQVAAQGTALTPTLAAITASLHNVRGRPDSPRKDWYVGGASVHGQLAAAAAEAGVTVLAGTDSRPHGRVTGEIRALAAAGISPHDAIAAGSWAARSFLGLPGLIPGAPADAVVYDTDPRDDLAQLDHPRAVILRDQLRHRRP